LSKTKQCLTFAATILLGFAASLVFSSAAHADEFCPLEIVRTIGGDDGEVFLHNPLSVTFAADGTIYLLNGGDCQVMQLDDQWTELNTFGACGEGPGEFSNPVGMVLYEDEVWVFELARITVYDLSGEYLRTMTPGLQYGAPVVIDGQLIARMGAGDRAAATLDRDGLATGYLGPECPTDFFEGFKKCRNMQILPHEDGACLMVNLVDGQALLVGENGDPVWDRYLTRKEDDSVMETSDDGESMSMSLSLAMAMGCRDNQGRYWMVTLPEDDDAQSRVSVLDGELKPVMDSFLLPEGIYSWQLACSPTGQMILVSTNESTLYVCDVVD